MADEKKRQLLHNIGVSEELIEGLRRRDANRTDEHERRSQEIIDRATQSRVENHDGDCCTDHGPVPSSSLTEEDLRKEREEVRAMDFDPEAEDLAALRRTQEEMRPPAGVGEAGMEGWTREAIAQFWEEPAEQLLWSRTRIAAAILLASLAALFLAAAFFAR
ncbi:MAG: hypothetical protein Q8P82_02285 [bacterium]|nr:hypothetical protein [bacterium]